MVVRRETLKASRSLVRWSRGMSLDSLWLWRGFGILGWRVCRRVGVGRDLVLGELFDALWVGQHLAAGALSRLANAPARGRRLNDLVSAGVVFWELEGGAR